MTDVRPIKRADGSTWFEVRDGGDVRIVSEEKARKLALALLVELSALADQRYATEHTNGADVELTDSQRRSLRVRA